MAFNIFKKDREKISFGKAPAKKEKKKPEKKEEKELENKSPKMSKDKKIGLAWNVLKQAHVTEKATDLAAKDKYVFKVYPTKNKKEIKKAVEDIYGVSVISVNIINIPAKKRRLGKISGWRGGYKKAIVKIKKGQEIELMPR